MKLSYVITIVISIVLIFIIGFTKYINVNKKIYKEECLHLHQIDSLIKSNKLLQYQIDSVKFENDSLKEDIFVANYKLIRIKEYNKIAAKGNNIKYLRGWINRVINE